MELLDKRIGNTLSIKLNYIPQNEGLFPTDNM